MAFDSDNADLLYKQGEWDQRRVRDREVQPGTRYTGKMGPLSSFGASHRGKLII